MRYLVKATTSIERGNPIDDKGGSVAVFEYIVNGLSRRQSTGVPPNERLS